MGKEKPAIVPITDEAYKDTNIFDDVSAALSYGNRAFQRFIDRMHDRVEMRKTDFLYMVLAKLDLDDKTAQGAAAALRKGIYEVFDEIVGRFAIRRRYLFMSDFTDDVTFDRKPIKAKEILWIAEEKEWKAVERPDIALDPVLLPDAYDLSTQKAWMRQYRARAGTRSVAHA